MKEKAPRKQLIYLKTLKTIIFIMDFATTQFLVVKLISWIISNNLFMNKTEKTKM